MDNFDLRKYLAEGKLNEEEMDFSYTELSNDEKDEVSDMMNVIYNKINPKGDMKKNTGLFKYIDAWFESKGDRLSRLNEEELTPLQKYIFDYESDISDEVDMRAIKGLENANDVYDYYANVRGWEGDPDLEDDLDNIYRQVKVKFG